MDRKALKTQEALKAMNAITVAYIIQEGKIVLSFMNQLKPVQSKIMKLLEVNFDCFIFKKPSLDNNIIFFPQ